MEIEKSHPSRGKWTKDVKYHAKTGSLFLMQGREVWHQSQPTIEETKMVAVFNYYTTEDQWRPEHFDEFVYKGKK
jgi:hypothetical protein